MRAAEKRWRRRLVVLLCAAFASPSAGALRVVAVGDVHGAIGELSTILRTTGLIDAEGDWSGRDAVLVQTGDLFDRGTGVRAVLDLLMRLQPQAASAGGEVVVLLGNHEQMNLFGIFRDLDPEVYTAFAAEESASERQEAFAEWRRWTEATESMDEGPASRERFDSLFPPGALAYRRALARQGMYGRWLRTLPVAAIRGDTLFVHGGLSPSFAEIPIAALDARQHETQAAVDAAREALVTRAGVPRVFGFFELFDATERLLTRARERPEDPGPLSVEELFRIAEVLEESQWLQRADAPLWFRGFAEWDEDDLSPLIETLRKRHLVKRVVAGHSSSRSATIETRLGGKVVLIDTGMLTRVYQGRASALEISDGRLVAEYPEHRQPLGTDSVLPVRILFGSDGNPVPFADAHEAETFLREAEVVSTRPLGEGVTHARKVQLQRGSLRLAAVFHQIDDSSVATHVGNATQTYFVDSWRAQVAAYELARLLGVDAVPPTVARKIRGEKGSLQLWVGNATSWKQARERGEESAGRPHFGHQWCDVRVFDALINNRDRNLGNVLVGPQGHLWWIDHTRSFDRQVTLSGSDGLRRISRQLWAALRGLDPDAVQARLSPYLSKFEIAALLERRQRLIELFSAAIATRGEDEVLFERDTGGGPKYAVR